ncbi:MAG: S8 family serine peptidase [Nostoc sp. LLA-1]|nr:S8 family serine peptidase [Cyanocohniella sp. LLY]
MKNLRLLVQRIITSGIIATTTAFSSFVVEVRAVTFSLPIEAAAKATGVDVLRDRYGLDGTGITIGFISDSFNTVQTFDVSGNLDTYATNIADGYLPAGINVLQDFFDPEATDEGRAIAQILHAVAPQANLVFHPGLGGVDVLSQGIQALAAAGANIIVDDVAYIPPEFPDAPLNFVDLESPDGPINQAIDAVFNQNISYFTEAGNNFPDFSIYGHANNPNALTVGAVYYGNSESYFNRRENVEIEQGQLQPFSSAGNPDFLKPDVVAPDGLPISFNLGGGSRTDINPGFFSFFGTSASAPYTAAVAALLLQADPSATPTEIYDALRETADSPISGFDSRLGFGLIQGDKAIAALGVLSKPIPEPSTTLAVVCVGVLIAGLSLKRTQRKSQIIAKPSERLTLVHSSFTRLHNT